MTGDVSSRKRFQFIARCIRESAPARWREARVLDLGCGKGELEAFLGSLGFRNLVGVEIDGPSLAAARDRLREFGFELVSGSAEEFLDAGGREDWDFVVCSEFLEHLRDPEGMVERIARRLKPQGGLIVTIPNGYGPWEVYHRLSERSRYANPGLEPPGALHVQRFTKNRLLEILTRRGFSLAKVRNSNFLSCVFPFNVPAYRSIDFFERIDCRIADWIPSRFASGWYFFFRRTP